MEERKPADKERRVRCQRIGPSLARERQLLEEARGGRDAPVRLLQQNRPLADIREYRSMSAIGGIADMVNQPTVLTISQNYSGSQSPRHLNCGYSRPLWVKNGHPDGTRRCLLCAKSGHFLDPA
jgi:hypothetical protein